MSDALYRSYVVCALRESELTQLCARSWHIDLGIPNIKVTLGGCAALPDILDGGDGEPWVSLLAYNMIRLLMAPAAQSASAQSRELNSKHTVDMQTARQPPLRPLFRPANSLGSSRSFHARTAIASNRNLAGDDRGLSIG